MPNMKALYIVPLNANGSKVMAKVKVFRHGGQRSQSMLLGQKFDTKRKASPEGICM